MKGVDEKLSEMNENLSDVSNRTVTLEVRIRIPSLQ